MTKKYMTALNALYGTNNNYPATIPLPICRSSNTRKPRSPQRHIEQGFQMRLVAWALGHHLPLLSIPNEGNRGRLATHKLKQMGLRPGAADLFLFRKSKCGQYPGYFIELKSPGRKPSANQLAFLADALKEGFKAEWFDDWQEARQAIEKYLGMEK